MLTSGSSLGEMSLELWLLFSGLVFAAGVVGQLIRGRRVRWGLALVPPVLFLAAALVLTKVVIPKMQGAGMQAVERRIERGW